VSGKQHKGPGSNLIGAHVSIAGGVSGAPGRGAAHGCTAIQIFTKAPGKWSAPALSNAECTAFQSEVEKHGIRSVVVHDAYLINLASPDKKARHRSMKAFLDEMNRCALLGIDSLVAHPGSHMGTSEDEGIQRIAGALKELLAAPETAGVRVLLETTAGQGNCLGWRFEHLARIISLLDNDPRLAVCFDTCHVFAAGYDIRTASSLAAVFREFDRIIGLDLLALFHLNDSRGGLGSRKDRHEHIGRGEIGEKPFRKIIRARRFKKVPKIIETPGGVDGGPDDMKNLELLFSYANARQPR